MWVRQVSTQSDERIRQRGRLTDLCSGATDRLDITNNTKITPANNGLIQKHAIPKNVRGIPKNVRGTSPLQA